MDNPASLPEFRVCNVKLHALKPEDALDIVRCWAASERRFHYISSTNVNNVAIAMESPEFYTVIENADLSLVDGVPFLWYGRFKGYPLHKRSGIEELMEAVFETSNHGANYSHFFFGNTTKVLEAMKRELLRRYPNLRIAEMLSPPFRPLTAQENEEYIRIINASGADFLWVSLGCPKQEQWLYDHRDRLRVVAGGGAGAVFNFFSGEIRKAPTWIRYMGMEWVFRLMVEPKRLYRRYLIRYPMFVFWFVQYSLGFGSQKEK